jgi:hypothetical protein
MGECGFNNKVRANERSIEIYDSLSYDEFSTFQTA